jgi:hypothetical protein
LDYFSVKSNYEFIMKPYDDDSTLINVESNL